MDHSKILRVILQFINYHMHSAYSFYAITSISIVVPNERPRDIE